ncbi:MAG: 50S ribosomal protein L5 [Candidatus Micrarchaeota archaeon]|nr:50S ribosomal protein L5 [Candidatus Micrarchaeota archaeon]
MNPMREVRIDKVTANIGVGEGGEKLQSCSTLLNKMSGKKAVKTTARVRNLVFKIKKGDPIGTKVTLRNKDAEEFLKKALDAVDKKISSRAFDKEGNFSFGIEEYIDFPGVKYDPKLGIVGFDVCVTLKRRGVRVTKKRRGKATLGRRHRLTNEDGITFAKEVLGVEIV